MVTRYVLLGAVLAALSGLAGLAGCAGAPEIDDITAAPSPTSQSLPAAPGEGPDEGLDSGRPTAPTSSPIGLPANACRLLDPITVARLSGARQAVAVPSAQGPFHTCEYRMATEAGASASVFLDVSGQRAQQLYDLATDGVQLSTLPAVGTRATLSPTTGKVYVLTSHAFFTIGLPTGFGELSTGDGLRSAAEQLAAAVVARLGP